MTKRIYQIVGEIENGKTLCDVGCDHGYVSYLAFMQGRCEKVVLTDISAPSLKKAEKLFDDNGLGYTSYVCDGMDSVAEKIDTAVICGMGGHEIMSILSKKRVEKLVLQPMLDVDTLRVFLQDSGYKIDKDYIFFSEGKFYNLIIASFGNCSLCSDEIMFGKNLQNMSQDFILYLQCKLIELDKILENSLPEQKRECLLKQQERIMEILQSENL